MGQTNRGDTSVNIPFAFRAANQTLPAGRYTITRIGETNLRFSDSHSRGVFVQTHSVEGKASEVIAESSFTATARPTSSRKSGSQPGQSGAGLF